MSSTVCTIAYCYGNLLRVVCTKSVNPICKVNLAGEPAAIVSIKGRAFLHLREDLRRIGEKLAEGLALSVRTPTGRLYGSRCSQPRTFPQAKKRLCQSADNKGLLAGLVNLKCFASVGFLIITLRLKSQT